MTPRLVELPPNGHAPNNAAIAAHLRSIADDIASGGAAPIADLVLVIEYDDGDLQRSSCGRPIALPHLIGLLTMAATRETFK